MEGIPLGHGRTHLNFLNPQVGPSNNLPILPKEEKEIAIKLPRDLPNSFRKSINISIQRRRNNDRAIINSREIEENKKTFVPDYVRVIVVKDVNGRKKELLIPASLDLERPKRPRTIFSIGQLQALESAFEENHFLSEEKRTILASSLGLTQNQIKIWFQNRRTKQRREGTTEKKKPKAESFPYNYCYTSMDHYRFYHSCYQ